jgi:RNA polymerase sigma factor (sigma-70 family)
MTDATAPDSPWGRVRPTWPRSDDRLAWRATKGDKRAFEAIYQRYHQDLYRFCLALLGNPQDAQDALQNTMVKVLRALPGEERRIQLKPWLYRIARNEAIETMRARRDSVEIEAEGVASPSDLEIAETAQARERLRMLITDLGNLPERQRAALVMRELAGLDFAQIGAAFKTSSAVARQTIYEARRSLRQMEAGREMSCEQVMRQLSDADGRVTRRRELRAHVRSCPNCRLFQDEIAERRGDFAAIAPLPLAASAGLLHGILGGKAGAAVGAGAGTSAGAGAGAGGGLATTIGAGAGKAVATSAIVKSAAAVAVVAAVGMSATDGSGLINVPIPGVHGNSTKPVSGLSGAAPAVRRVSPVTGKSSAAGTVSQGSADKGGGAVQRGAQQRQQHQEPGRSVSGHSEKLRSEVHQPHRHGAPHHGHHGRPEELPPAAEHGQQTAAAHKPPTTHPQHQAHGPPPVAGIPAPKPAPPPKETAQEPAPPAEPPAEGKGKAFGHAAERQEPEG